MVEKAGLKTGFFIFWRMWY